MPNVCTPFEGTIHNPPPGTRRLLPSSPRNRDRLVSASRIRSPSQVFFDLFRARQKRCRGAPLTTRASHSSVTQPFLATLNQHNENHYEANTCYHSNQSYAIHLFFVSWLQISPAT